MRWILGLSLLVAAAAGGADEPARFTFEVLLPDGMPGVIDASVGEQKGARRVTCSYRVDQSFMDLPDLALGTWSGVSPKPIAGDAVRGFCLDHYFEISRGGE